MKDFTLLSRMSAFAVALFLGFSVAVAPASAGDVTGEPGDMSVEEALDNMGEDAGKVGDKAEEIGSDIADEAEKAYDGAKEEVEESSN